MSRTSLNRIIHRELKRSKLVKNTVRITMEKQFKIAHKKLMHDFDSHKVTRELEAGPSAENITGSLREGNLFGFIGFDESHDPIAPLRKSLASANILIHKRINSQPLAFIYKVHIASMGELHKLTPLPWATGASWLQELEGRGIPNLGQYRFKDSQSSRSGAGIQADVGEGGRLRIEYMEILLKEFEKDLNQIRGGMKA